MKIVFMGTPDFAVMTLAAIADAGYEVTGVVTQPDRPKGRKKEPVPCPVKEEALRRGIPVYQPAKVRNNPEAYEAIRDMEPDLIVVAAFGQIIPKEILTLPGLGCVNVHASLLPAYRGAAPIQHMILDGCTKAGVTIMQMDEGLDTGDIISTWETPIDPEETGGTLFDKLAKGGAELLVRTLPSICDGTAVRTPQGAESPTAYASMMKKESGRIDWTCDADYIERLVRAMNPWPSAYTHLGGKTLKIWKAAYMEKQGTAGTFCITDDKEILAFCGEGSLLIREVQMEGRRRMTTEDFLRGFRIETFAFDDAGVKSS